MITRHNYHQRHDYVSKSALDAINKSPHFYWHKYLSGAEEKEQTDALVFGGFFHCYMLEPHLLNELYFMPSEKIDKRTKAGRQAIEESDKIYISPDLVEKAQQMKASIMSIPTCAYLLDSRFYEAEVILTDTCKVTGQLLKCRLDLYNSYYESIVDLKTTLSASPAEFSKSVAKYRYHVQDAYYRDIAERNGLKVKHFYFIAIEKEPPYTASVFELEDEAVELGREEYAKNLKTLTECKASLCYPNYTNNLITKINLPSWYGKQ